MNALNYNGEVSIRYEEVSMEDADAFFSAVADGDYDKMVSMLDEGRANVNQTDSDGFSALMIAASEGHEKIVKERRLRKWSRRYLQSYYAHLRMLQRMDVSSMR